MTDRVNLVDAYDNRSVVAKLVNMEERISGAETSVEASAEAAASSASAAAVSLAAAKTSEANAKASADTAAATLSNTVDLSSKQTITGAKTFAGDTTVTGQLISSGTNTLSGTTELEGTVELDSTAVATLNGKVTASNTGNVIKVANHDTALISNDVLSAKDINTPNGDANNLVHRSGISGESVVIPLTLDRSGTYFGENMLYFQSHGNADGTFPSIERHGLMIRHSSDSGTPSNFQARLFILFNTDGSGELRFDVSKKWSDGASSYKSKTLAKFTAEGVIS